MGTTEVVVAAARDSGVERIVFLSYVGAAPDSPNAYLRSDVTDAVERALLDPDAPSGVFDLGGPEEMSMDDFVRALNRGKARIVHLPPSLAQLAGRLLPSLTPALVDLLVRDYVVKGLNRSAVDAFGLRSVASTKSGTGPRAYAEPPPGSAHGMPQQDEQVDFMRRTTG